MAEKSLAGITVDVDPDGSRWYVALINANRVLQYDAATNEVIAEAVLDPTFKPGMLHE